jgi:hypothetical protein
MRKYLLLILHKVPLENDKGSVMVNFNHRDTNNLFIYTVLKHDSYF